MPLWIPRHYDMKTLSTSLASCEGRESMTSHQWIPLVMWPMESHHKGPEMLTLIFPLLLAWTNCWTVMLLQFSESSSNFNFRKALQNQLPPFTAMLVDTSICWYFSTLLPCVINIMRIKFVGVLSLLWDYKSSWIAAEARNCGMGTAVLPTPENWG